MNDGTDHSGQSAHVADGETYEGRDRKRDGSSHGSRSTGPKETEAPCEGEEKTMEKVVKAKKTKGIKVEKTSPSMDSSLKASRFNHETKGLNRNDHHRVKNNYKGSGHSEGEGEGEGGEEKEKEKEKEKAKSVTQPKLTWKDLPYLPLNYGISQIIEDV
jgi:hypothetical protein